MSVSSIPVENSLVELPERRQALPRGPAHILAAKVASVVFVLIVTGTAAATLLSVGAPLPLVVLVSSYAFGTSCFLTYSAFKRYSEGENLVNRPNERNRTRVVEKTVYHDGTNLIQSHFLIYGFGWGDSGYLFPIENFEEVVNDLGPRLFKDKFEQEILFHDSSAPKVLKHHCCSGLGAYEMICKELTKINASDDYFGPLPRVKAHFVEKFGRYSCEKLLAEVMGNKEMISHFEKSQILSREKASLLHQAFDLRKDIKQLESSQPNSSIAIETKRNSLQSLRASLNLLEQQFQASGW